MLRQFFENLMNPLNNKQMLLLWSSLLRDVFNDVLQSKVPHHRLSLSWFELNSKHFQKRMTANVLKKRNLLCVSTLNEQTWIRNRLSTLLLTLVRGTSSQADTVEWPVIKDKISAGFCCRWMDQSRSGSGGMSQRSSPTMFAWLVSSWENRN